MKNQRGITLIALVITIIVLLILAGVSIATLSGDNGLLSKATDAKIATKKAEVIEKVNMELSAIFGDVMSDKPLTTSDPATDADKIAAEKKAIVDRIAASEDYIVEVAELTKDKLAITVTAAKDTALNIKTSTGVIEKDTNGKWKLTLVKD